jgi:general secretion pathway protein A
LSADFSFFRIDAPKQSICNDFIRDLEVGFSRFIVTGASGVGKTQLLRYFLTQLPLETQSIFLSGNCLNYSDRIRFIVELTTENSLLGKKSLVVIDNAHEIPEEDLRLLFSLISQNKNNRHPLPIIFSGLMTLETKLELFGFNQNIGEHCRRYHVSEMDESQVWDYINFRLLQVGYMNTGDQELFSSSVVNLITVLSKGIPQAINLLCGASLLIASLEDKRIISEKIVYEAAKICLFCDQNTEGKPEQVDMIKVSKKTMRFPVLYDHRGIFSKSVNSPVKSTQVVALTGS